MDPGKDTPMDVKCQDLGCEGLISLTKFERKPPSQAIEPCPVCGRKWQFFLRDGTIVMVVKASEQSAATEVYGVSSEDTAARGGYPEHGV